MPYSNQELPVAYLSSKNNLLGHSKTMPYIVFEQDSLPLPSASAVLQAETAATSPPATKLKMPAGKALTPRKTNGSASSLTEVFKTGGLGMFTRHQSISYSYSSTNLNLFLSNDCFEPMVKCLVNIELYSVFMLTAHL